MYLFDDPHVVLRECDAVRPVFDSLLLVHPGDFAPALVLGLFAAAVALTFLAPANFGSNSTSCVLPAVHSSSTSLRSFSAVSAASGDSIQERVEALSRTGREMHDDYLRFLEFREDANVSQDWR